MTHNQIVRAAAEGAAVLAVLTAGAGAAQAMPIPHGPTYPVQVTGTYSIAELDGFMSPWKTTGPDLHRIQLRPGQRVVVVAGECAPVDPVTDVAPPRLVRDAGPNQVASCGPVLGEAGEGDR